LRPSLVTALFGDVPGFSVGEKREGAKPSRKSNDQQDSQDIRTGATRCEPRTAYAENLDR
jgi:hypothetical protein